MPTAIVHSETAAVVTPTVAIREDSFEPALAENSRLCLEFSKDRFRFCVLELPKRTGEPRCFWMEDYTFSSLLTDNPLLASLQTIYRDHPVLQNGFWKNIHVSINAPYFTLIPSALFRKEYASQYLHFMRGNAHPAAEHAHAFGHAEGFHSVFNVDVWLTDWLAATYPLQQVQVVHQTSALIQVSALQSLPSFVMLYFEEEYVTVIHRREGELAFCNRFAYKNSTDLVYYILYVIHELKLEPKNLPVVLFGEITPYADSYVSLERFLPNMTFGKSLSGLGYAPGFDDLPEHRYISLFGTGLLE